MILVATQTKGAPPAAVGPVGPEFEVKVGSSYFLAMLCDAPARGLPGSIIETVSFQQGDDGYPMDDIVVTSTLHSGETATLEIQAKRSITFAPKDQVFKKVMSQVAKAVDEDGFWERRAELAVATSQTSRQISGPYQEVLNWARETVSEKVFFARLERKGTANDDMRSFVSTFREHLSTFGAAHDYRSVWRLLRRFQILVFDFSKIGGAEDYWAIERCRGLLTDNNRNLAGALWSTITTEALATDASNGSLNRGELVKKLAEKGFTLEARWGARGALRNLAEMSGFALEDVSDSIQGMSIARHPRIEELHAALSKGRYLEIQGGSGVGKSALMKRYISQITNSPAVLFLSPNRTTPGGWQALRHTIEFSGNAEEFLVELSATGSSIICIDNFDHFAEQEKATVKDLVRAASKVRGVQIIATARTKIDYDEPNWLPTKVLDELGRAPVVTIEELSDQEVKELKAVDPKLAALLMDDHPAKSVARNLFRLSRLALLPPEVTGLRTEIDLANLWWSTGDGRNDGDRRGRQRLLRAMAQHYTKSNDFFSSNDYSSKAIQQLVSSETLLDHGNDQVSFKHDVLREWAVACLLNFNEAVLNSLDLAQSGGPSLLRSLELQTQMMIGAGNKSGWVGRLDALSHTAVHPSWYRAALLAIIHFEASSQILKDLTTELLADDAEIGRQLISLAIATESQTLEELFPDLDGNMPTIPEGLVLPKNASWDHLLVWLLQLEKIPPTVISIAAELMCFCLNIEIMGGVPYSKAILPQFYNWLVEIENAKSPKHLQDHRGPFGGELSYEQLISLEGKLRSYFCFLADKAPDLAVRYLNSVSARISSDRVVTKILKMSGNLAKAAPKELSGLTRNALIPDQSSRKRRREDYDQGLSFIDRQFMPESPAQGPFFALLTHCPEEGFKLIYDLVNHVIDFQIKKWDIDDEPIIVPFDTGDRVFRYPQSFHWSRHSDCYSVTSALMALEAWGHKRVENGDTPTQVVLDILAPETAPVATLTVAIDILLSSDQVTYADLLPFLASPELVAMDRFRLHVQDSGEQNTAGEVFKSYLKGKPSRQICLEMLVPDFSFRAGKELREELDKKL